LLLVTGCFAKYPVLLPTLYVCGHECVGGRVYAHRGDDDGVNDHRDGDDDVHYASVYVRLVLKL
jgi:hypothetical protein